MIKVQIACKSIADGVWKHIEMQPTQYFWVDPDDPTREWAVDSTPKHDLISQLLSSIQSEKLEKAVTKVTDDETGDYCECSYHFWRDHESYACLSIFRMGNKIEKELIFAGVVPFKDNGSQVVRVTLDDSVPVVTMNTFMWGAGGDEYSLDMLREEEADKAFKADVPEHTRP